ncbi:GrpB family protein [Paenibacillus sp. MAH-36]|uniref:GrpB family protein n=1 Tax=Paenibacillus violae TaxID=3077234 RepID=A0ABU3RPY9_9BACL|nr:GrpB family protein [Paenibacillus sp. PFR10]MDU0206381.1 GrpB family protein [Paenibacillus sp. PFR10]
MLGLPKGEVYLIPWTNEWVTEFRNESEKIKFELGELVLAVHHIGSTAVKNLSAKPIIDIAIELNDYQRGIQCIEGLKRLGYEYKGTNILPERYYFSKGEPRTHQIHMFQTNNLYMKKQLAFRDFLQNDSEALNGYQALKEKLSSTHYSDKITYSHAKTDFINTILKNLGFN